MTMSEKSKKVAVIPANEVSQESEMSSLLIPDSSTNRELAGMTAKKFSVIPVSEANRESDVRCSSDSGQAGMTLNEKSKNWLSFLQTK